MAKPYSTQAYTPNAALKSLYRRYFERIQVDPAWAAQMRDLSEKDIFIVMQ